MKKIIKLICLNHRNRDSRTKCVANEKVLNLTSVMLSLFDFFRRNFNLEVFTCFSQTEPVEVPLTPEINAKKPSVISIDCSFGILRPYVRQAQ